MKDYEKKEIGGLVIYTNGKRAYVLSPASAAYFKFLEMRKNNPVGGWNESKRYR